jgi:hypothetical protein
MRNLCKKCGNPKMVEVFAAYIIRNGDVVYPKKAKRFHFFVCGNCSH